MHEESLHKRPLYTRKDNYATDLPTISLAPKVSGTAQKRDLYGTATKRDLYMYAYIYTHYKADFCGI